MAVMTFADFFALGLLAQYGSVGPALITVCSVAGLAIAGGLTFSYMAHAFAVILEGTAAGQDEITWPNEPIVDRLGKAAIMGWVILVSASLPFVVGKIFAGNSVGAWVFTLTGFGLVFPVVVLSIQSSNTLFGIINSQVLARLAKRPEYWACYYLAIAPVLLCIGVGVWAAFRYNLLVVIVASFVVAVCLLIASRLLGRLAQLVGQTRVKRREKADDSEAPPLDLGEVADIAAARSEGRSVRTRSEYGIRQRNSPEPTSASPTPSFKRIWVEEGADDPYALADAPAKVELPREFVEPSEYEMKLALRNQPNRPPKHPWLSNTYTFPFSANMWPALIWLTFGLSIAGGFARIVVAWD